VSEGVVENPLVGLEPEDRASGVEPSRNQSGGRDLERGDSEVGRER
jgi:hypothetical protein